MDINIPNGNELDAETYKQFRNGYVELVNRCRLNQQVAYWAVLLPETADAIRYLGISEARNTLHKMVDKAIEANMYENRDN